MADKLPQPLPLDYAQAVPRRSWSKGAICGGVLGLTSGPCAVLLTVLGTAYLRYEHASKYILPALFLGWFVIVLGVELMLLMHPRCCVEKGSGRWFLRLGIGATCLWPIFVAMAWFVLASHADF